MSDEFTIGGEGDDWQVFGKTPPGGREVFFRSRAGNPALRSFALEHEMMRVRCVLREDQVDDNGMPKSTSDLDEYEDRLLDALSGANAEVYLLAIITGDGNRDLFFAARDLDDLRSGIKTAQTDVDTFKLQLAPVGNKEAFLDGLTLSPEQQQQALEQGRVHVVPPSSGGGFLGKLFKR